MHRLNRDTVVAIFLLVGCGVFFYDTVGIKAFPEQMSPALWPRIILTVMTVLVLIYLGQSIISPKPAGITHGGIIAWFKYYRNPILCYVCFFVFLLALPYLGMLISGVLFVFALTTILGGFTARDIRINAAVALFSVGGMWLIFTKLLGVILPTAFFTYAF
jgi:putative tricarboxylic transport membrane protein